MSIRAYMGLEGDPIFSGVRSDIMEQAQALKSLKLEHENIMQALDHFVNPREIQRIKPLAGFVWFYLDLLSRWREGLTASMHSQDAGEEITATGDSFL
ncbi:MAG: hypothetical protein V2G42_00085 [bacterium JZ-2024 1]